jgi:hypothetical protein
MDATMSTPQLLPADGDPTEDPAAAELAPAQRDQPDDADTPRTEHPVPESFPSGGFNGANI